MALLNRGQFLSRKEKSRPTEDYPIKAAGWEGETVRIRGLSARDREKAERRFSRATEQGEDAPSLRCWLVSLSLVNEANELLFGPDDIKQLEDMGQDVIIELFDEVMRFNGFSKEAQEQIRKNSETTPSEGLPSSSPGPSANGTLTASSAG